MAVFDHQEQEQLSELRALWEQHGKLVTAAVMALAIAAVGWQGYRWYRNQQSAGAASLYAVVEKGSADNSSQRTREAAGQIIDQYGNTTYAQLAALTAAHAQLEGGDLKSARAQLTWMAEKGGDEALRAMARLRLAALQLDEKAFDEALRTLAAPVPPAYAFRAADLKGDVLFAQGKRAEARKVWQDAIAAFDASGIGGTTTIKELVQLKLDSVAGDK